MKKSLILLLILAVLFAGFAFLGRPKDIVRIHIRAVSDSEEDQARKLRVRDTLNAYLAPGLTACRTKAEAVAYLSGELDTLRALAEREAGVSVTVTLGQEDFPERTYNGKTFPAGEYTALIVTLGEGRGHNWWCVAFPPLCYQKAEGAVQYRSWIADLLNKWGIL